MFVLLASVHERLPSLSRASRWPLLPSRSLPQQGAASDRVAIPLPTQGTEGRIPEALRIQEFPR